MKKITITISLFLLLVSGAGFTSAHSGSSNSPMDTMMRQMMGDSTFSAMEEMEYQMMGEENHARMEELMNKMLAGNLSPDDQKEMTRMMQDTMAGPGAMTMMMRMMLAQYGSEASRSGMPQMMQNLGFWPTFHWSYWVTIVLIWAVLVLAIIALVWWLKKK